MKLNIQDNFLAEEEFIALRDTIITDSFPWYFSPTTVDKSREKETTPGLFVHAVYYESMPCSKFLPLFEHILDRMNVEILLRIKLNLQPRLPEPEFSTFHSDTIDFVENLAAQWTTSILYINTNNGYTELKDGTKIESIANRLVSFPSNIEHRGVTQTDEQTRIIVNFNYLTSVYRKVQGN